MNSLIDAVLTKHQWTQTQLAQNLNVSPETISRWRRGAGIHQGHYNEMVRLSADEIVVAPTSSKFNIPFILTIPRNSIKFSLDKNGNIKIDGLATFENGEGK